MPNVEPTEKPASRKLLKTIRLIGFFTLWCATADYFGFFEFWIEQYSRAESFWEVSIFAVFFFAPITVFFLLLFAAVYYPSTSALNRLFEWLQKVHIHE